MKTTFNSVLFILLLIPAMIFAQSTVSGTVTEQSTSTPLPGVNVLIKGTSTGTSTDFDGNYTLSVNNGDVIVFSYVGYATQEITYNGQTTINVQLTEDAALLDEIVVIGYGAVKKEDLTGSADLITSEDFNQGPVVSAQQLIQGKIAGVSVTSGGGAPGEGQNIIIRGLGSLSLTSSPLIVVDGLPLDNGGVGGSRNPLNLINPNDIESMVVLKDASATAIYGSRAANGVIMITTKKGKDRDFQFNFNSSVMFSNPTDQVDVLTGDTFRSLVVSTGDAAAIGRLGSHNTDWQSLIYNDAISTDNSFSALGNAWGVPMRASIGYSDQGGILEGDKFSRTTASLSLTPSLLDDHLKVEVNARGMYTENKFANRGAIGNAVSFDPTKSIYDTDPTIVSQFGGFTGWYEPLLDQSSNVIIHPDTGLPVYSRLNLSPVNPLALLKYQDDTAEVRRIVTNAKFDYKIHGFEDITATVNVGIDKSHSNGRNIVDIRMPQSLLAESWQEWDGARYAYTNQSTNRLFDAYLTYQKEFNEVHNLNVVAGYSYQDFEYDNYSFNSELQEQGSEFEFIDKSKNVLLSYFGRLNYSFDNRYLLTATLRADASSKLNPDDRWGIFPSAAFAWNIHNESFMEESTFNELKLRVGYGEVGNVNGLGDYLFLTRYTGSTSTANYLFGSQYYQSFRPEPFNENLRWEIGRTINIGLDYSLLEGRIGGSVNLYKKETQDLIASATVDPFTNFGSRVDTNIGDMENKGVEFILNLTPIKTEDFEWNINYNISYNENKVTNLPFDQDVGGISGGVGNTIQRHVVGQEPYSFFVYHQLYDVAGNPIEGAFADLNGDNIINEQDRYYKEDPYADILMGLNTNISYKNWDFAVVTRASIGNYAYDNVASSSAYLARATDNNILTNLHADYLQTGFTAITDTNLLSDHYIQEASFFKIDNITVGYTWNDAFEGTNIRFYSSFQNVATITDYTGLDPEITGGIDNNFYPRPRTAVFGINVDF